MTPTPGLSPTRSESETDRLGLPPRGRRSRSGRDGERSAEAQTANGRPRSSSGPNA